MCTGACGPPVKLSLALEPRSYVLRMTVKLPYWQYIRLGELFPNSFQHQDFGTLSKSVPLERNPDGPEKRPWRHNTADHSPVSFNFLAPILSIAFIKILPAHYCLTDSWKETLLKVPKKALCSALCEGKPIDGSNRSLENQMTKTWRPCWTN